MTTESAPRIGTSRKSSGRKLCDERSSQSSRVASSSCGAHAYASEEEAARTVGPALSSAYAKMGMKETSAVVSESVSAFDDQCSQKVAPWCRYEWHMTSAETPASEAEAMAHLRLMADHLESGGLYVLALHLVDRPELIVESETFHAERDGVAVTCVLGGEDPDLEQRRQRIHARLHVEKPDGSLKTHESSWWFRTWTLAQFMNLLAAEPRFELVALHDYGLDPNLHYELEDDLVDMISVLRRR